MSLDERLTRAVHHVADTVPAPEVDLVAVRGTARANHRRAVAMAVAACATVVVAGVGIAGAALSRGERAQGPVQQPSPTVSESPSTSVEWAPERIRAEGSPGDVQGAIPTTESGLATRLYVVCDGASCDIHTGFEDLHAALEVIQDGRSAVFDFHMSSQPWVRAFDEDSVLVQDPVGVGTDQPVRYRLLRADGTAVQLRLLDDPAPAVAGPGVFVIDDWDLWSGGMDGIEEVYLVDDTAGTLRPLDVPEEEIRYWGPNVDEFLWGVTDDCRVYWETEGTFAGRRLDCRDDMKFSFMADEWFPDGWLRPGRMVLAEQREPNSDTPVVLHVSLDAGTTWQQIPIHNADDDNVRDALQQIG